MDSRFLLILLLVLFTSLGVSAQMPYILGTAIDTSAREYNLDNGYKSKSISRSYFFGVAPDLFEGLIHFGKYSDESIVKSIRRFELNRKHIVFDGPVRIPVGIGMIYDFTISKKHYDYYKTSDVFLDASIGLEFKINEILAGLDLKFLKKIYKFKDSTEAHAFHDYEDASAAYLFLKFNY